MIRDAMIKERAWHPWGATLLAVAAVLLLYALPGAGACLQYDRVQVGQGEWWRLLTSHWVHWSGDHLRWDLLAFAALAFCALRTTAWRTLAMLVTASVWITAAVWLVHPGMTAYRGLSGLDSALFVLVAVGLLLDARAAGRRHVAILLWGMLAVFAAKLVYEVATGDTLFVQAMGAGVTAVPLAHLVGGAVGAVFAAGGSGKVFSPLGRSPRLWHGRYPAAVRTRRCPAPPTPGG